MAMTPQAVLAMCRERDIKAVDMRFMDFPSPAGMDRFVERVLPRLNAEWD